MHVIRMSMELSILYCKGLPVKISIKWCISVPEEQRRPRRNAYISTCLPLSRMKRVNSFHASFLIFILFLVVHRFFQNNVFKKFFLFRVTGLQIYGAPAPLTHYFKIWCTTFQGSGPSGGVLLSCQIIPL